MPKKYFWISKLKIGSNRKPKFKFVWTCARLRGIQILRKKGIKIFQTNSRQKIKEILSRKKEYTWSRTYISWSVGIWMWCDANQTRPQTLEPKFPKLSLSPWTWMAMAAAAALLPAPELAGYACPIAVDLPLGKADSLFFLPWKTTRQRSVALATTQSWRSTWTTSFVQVQQHFPVTESGELAPLSISPSPSPRCSGAEEEIEPLHHSTLTHKNKYFE